jgi:hypothetical protein
MVVERWRRPGLVGPVILIVLGLVLLLSTLGLLEVSWWELWRLWPLLLVLAGLDILSRHSRWASAVVAVLTLVLVAGVFYLLVTRPEPLRPFFAASSGALVVNPVSEELAGAERVDVQIDLGVGDLRLSALQDSGNLLEGYLNYPGSRGRAPGISYSVSAGVGRLRLESRTREGWVIPFTGYSSGENWTVRLSRKVPLSIDIDAGASSSVLDLSYLQLKELNVEAGVGHMDVLFPAEGDRMTARIQGGVGELVLRIPESVAARVRVEGGLGGKQLSSRFHQAGDGTYETAGYGSAANRLDVVVEGGVGSLRVQ